MLDFTRRLTAVSALRYAMWRCRGAVGPVTLALRGGRPRFELRGGRANDYGVAYEIFVEGFYRPRLPLDPTRVRLVADLGANVGLSVLHWLQGYAECRVLAWEPHPAHTMQIRRNLALNGWEGRVSLHEAAAGVAAARLPLSDEGSSSELGVAGPGAIEVPVEDVFATLLGRRVDILKIDIEGAEYPILEDPRFDVLDLGAVVMEWHSRGSDPAADRRWCEDRLRSRGFEVVPIMDHGTAGMFWAAPPDRRA